MCVRERERERERETETETERDREREKENKREREKDDQDTLNETQYLSGLVRTGEGYPEKQDGNPTERQQVQDLYCSTVRTRATEEAATERLCKNKLPCTCYCG